MAGCCTCNSLLFVDSLLYMKYLEQLLRVCYDLESNENYDISNHYILESGRSTEWQDFVKHKV